MSKITEIICIIDKSGSMYNIQNDTIGGFNSFIDEQKKLDGKANITVTLFSNSIETLVEGLDIHNFGGLNGNNYQLSGTTALLDAIGFTLSKIKEDENKNYIVVILTDGHENSSKEYSLKTINKLVKDKTDKDWKFIYLGANQDAIQVAGDLGISGLYSGEFVADSDGIANTLRNVSVMTSSYRTTGKMSSYQEADSEQNINIQDDKDIKDNISKSLESLRKLTIKEHNELITDAKINGSKTIINDFFGED